MSVEEEDTEKWVKYYSSIHQILLVGEGDFSFSLCLAQSFGLAVNIVASSLDARDDVIKKYKKAISNLDELQKLGACVLHGVDATKMKLHPHLNMRKFDRIIFNFPHAGFHGREDSISLIKKHRNLVHGFLTNARSMLRPYGEIHVNHKTTAPFSDWNIQKLGEQSSLTLIECADFNEEDYPGYNNRRGDSLRCDEPFPLGKCSTFKFAYIPKTTKKKPKIGNQSNLNRYPLRSHVLKMNERVAPPVISSRINGYPPIFGGYTNNGLELHGRAIPGSICSISDDVQRSMPAWAASSNVSNRAVPGSVCSSKYDLQRSMPAWAASSNVSNGAASGSVCSSNYDLERSMPAWAASSNVSDREVSGSICSFSRDLQRSMPAWPASSYVANMEMAPLSVGARTRNELYQSEDASYYLQRMRLEPDYFVPYSVGRPRDVETYIQHRLDSRVIGRPRDVETYIQHRLDSSDLKCNAEIVDAKLFQ